MYHGEAKETGTRGGGGLTLRTPSFPAPDRFPLSPATRMGGNGSRDVDKADTIVEVIGGQK